MGHSSSTYCIFRRYNQLELEHENLRRHLENMKSFIECQNSLISTVKEAIEKHPAYYGDISYAAGVEILKSFGGKGSYILRKSESAEEVYVMNVKMSQKKSNRCYRIAATKKAAQKPKTLFGMDHCPLQ